MRQVIVILFLSSVCSFSYSQNRTSAIIEFGGGSGPVSLNAEYAILQKVKYQVNLRVGFGYFPQRNYDLYSVPLGGNLIYNLKNRHHIETGLVVAYTEGSTAAWHSIGSEGVTFVGRALYFSPSLGYRYDKLESGLILRLCYSPLIVLQDYFDRSEIVEAYQSEYGSSVVPPFGHPEFTPVAKNYVGMISLSVGYRL